MNNKECILRLISVQYRFDASPNTGTIFHFHCAGQIAITNKQVNVVDHQRLFTMYIILYLNV